MAVIVLLNKPYGVISQFREHETHPSLAEFIKDPDLRLAGRLDTDSEGLVILSDTGALIDRVTSPKFNKTKTYLVQVEGLASDQQIEQLRAGVELKDGKTRPAKVELIEEPMLWLRQPPVRFRKSVPTSWLKMQITEGKNRQVRRMTAHVGLPTLRLVRTQVAGLMLKYLAPGESMTVELNTRLRQSLGVWDRTNSPSRSR